MSADFNNEQLFICKFSCEKSKHYLKKPKYLPCGDTACATCILESSRGSQGFECKYCTRLHRIDEAMPNCTIEKLFVENLSVLARLKLEEYKKVTINVKDGISKREKRLNKVINFIEDEMEIRFESIKLELDKLNVKLLRKVDKIERSIGKKMRKLNEIQPSNELIENTCKTLNTLKRVRFQSELNDLPNYYHIGYLNALNMINIHKIKTNTPVALDMKDVLKYPTSMCTLQNDTLLVTDNQQNAIYILDSKFSLVQQVSSIGDVTFNGPRGISTNQVDSVYLCDTGNDRVVIMDINFKMIKRVIGRKGKGVNEFDWPTDVCFSEDNFYVLDEINYRVQQFNSVGDFVKVVYVKKASPTMERSNIFKKLAVYNNLIAISNRYFVYIVNFEGVELQKLGHLGVTLRSLFLSDSYLITHNSTGSIICYGLHNINEKNEKRFSPIFERTMEILKKPTSCIGKFGDKILFSCMCDNLLIAL